MVQNSAAAYMLPAVLSVLSQALASPPVLLASKLGEQTQRVSWLTAHEPDVTSAGNSPIWPATPCGRRMRSAESRAARVEPAPTKTDAAPNAKHDATRAVLVVTSLPTASGLTSDGLIAVPG